MALLIRRAVTWVLLLAMPFHALTAVYLDLRGRTHFHLEDGVHEHDHGHSHAHRHGDLERHHHQAGDPTVVIVDDDAALEPLALDEGTTGWSSTMCVTLVSAGASLHLVRMANGIAPGGETLLQSRFLGRLERPPRISPV